jgi:hypothetical protein
MTRYVDQINHRIHRFSHRSPLQYVIYVTVLILCGNIVCVIFADSLLGRRTGGFDKTRGPGEYFFAFVCAQRRLPDAEMVVMELVNHLKFLGEDKAARTGIPWPKKRSSDGGPLVANFYMEPSTQFIDYTTSPALKPFVDIRCVFILKMGAAPRSCAFHEWHPGCRHQPTNNACCVVCTTSRLNGSTPCMIAYICITASRPVSTLQSQSQQYATGAAQQKTT